MKYLDRIRIRTALFFCLASVVPLAVVCVLLCGRIYATVRSAARDLDRTLALSVQTSVDDRLEFYRERCTALVFMPGIQSLDRTRQRPILAQFLDTNSIFLKLMTFDREGKLVSVLWRNGYRGEDGLVGTRALAAEPVLSKALTRAYEHSERVFTEVTRDAFGQPVLYLVTPIPHFVHENRVVGALVGGIQLSGRYVQSLLDKAHLGDESYACIVDDHGTILARRGKALPGDLDAHDVPMVVDGRPVRYLPLDQPFVSGRVELAGRPMLSTAARLTSIGLTLVVGRPLDLVTAPADETLWEVAFLCLAGLVFAVALSVPLSGSFVRPVLGLADGIRCVRSGRLSHRVAVERPDEVGLAAGAFNEMAEELETQRVLEQIWTERWPTRA